MNIIVAFLRSIVRPVAVAVTVAVAVVSAAAVATGAPAHAATAGAAASGGPGSPAPNPRELTIGSSVSPLSLPLEVARAQGFFEAEGVAVRIVECKGGPQCVGALLERRLQMVLATDLPLALRSAERPDFAIVATVTSASGNIRALGRRSAGVSGPEQLADKRVGFLPGTSAHYYLDSFLLFHGVDPARIRRVALEPEEVESAFASRRIDALVAYSRHVGPAMAELGTDAILLPEPRIYTETFNLAVDRRTLEERRPEIVRVLRALQRAELHIAAHPAESKALLVARTRLAPAYVDAIYPQYTYRLGLDQSLVSSMDGILRWARSAGLVPAGAKPPNLLDIVDAAPLKAAVPSVLVR